MICWGDCTQRGQALERPWADVAHKLCHAALNSIPITAPHVPAYNITDKCYATAFSRERFGAVQTTVALVKFSSGTLPRVEASMLTSITFVSCCSSGNYTPRIPTHASMPSPCTGHPARSFTWTKEHLDTQNAPRA